MNQEEKCRKEVVREENKRRLIFFPCTSGFHWDSDFTGSHGASATAGAALLQRRDHVGSILC